MLTGGIIVTVGFLSVVLFALHRKGRVVVTLSVFKRLLEFSLDANDPEPAGVPTPLPAASKNAKESRPK